jgi:hypothetical protein
MADPTTPPTPDNHEPDKYSEQDKLILAYVADSEKFIETASTDPEISEILLGYGYDAAEFAIGTGLAEAAHGAIEDRATGKGKQSEATNKLVAAIKARRAECVQYREIARACFPGDADRTALSLKGDLVDDTGRFITLAKASYGAGKKEPYTTKLSRRGYPPARLDLLITGVSALTKTGSEQDIAQGDAELDTTARDTAYDELREWMKELKGIARGVLKGKVGLKAKLEL